MHVWCSENRDLNKRFYSARTELHNKKWQVSINKDDRVLIRIMTESKVQVHYNLYRNFEVGCPQWFAHVPTSTFRVMAAKRGVSVTVCPWSNQQLTVVQQLQKEGLFKDILPQPPLGEQHRQSPGEVNSQSLVGQSQHQPLKEIISQPIAVHRQNLQSQKQDQSQSQPKQGVRSRVAKKILVKL